MFEIWRMIETTGVEEATNDDIVETYYIDMSGKKYAAPVANEVMMKVSEKASGSRTVEKMINKK